MIRKYRNGNVLVTIDDETGTKTRFTKDDDFEPEFAECVDIHISDRCDNGCQYCYASCSLNGKDGDFNHSFIDKMHPHTEVAINLQIPVPSGLMDFLRRLKEQDVIVNVTVNQDHFMQSAFRTFLHTLQKDGFIYGIGISLIDAEDEFFLSVIGDFKNVVIHCINGIVTTGQLYQLSKVPNINVLILGYKNVGRGESYVKDDEAAIEVRKRKDFLYWNIGSIIKEKWFKTISFDGLALDQLNVKRYLTDTEWSRFYQGEEGTSTFFINLVDGSFGINSMTTRNERQPIGDRSIDEMFKAVRKHAT